MPKGHPGEKRPADVIGAALLVGRIATGEAEDTRMVARGRVALIDARAAAPAKRGPYKKRSA